MGSSFQVRKLFKSTMIILLREKNSIEVAQKTPSTGGQRENPKIDASTTQENKGQRKHKGKKPKVTFAQLLKKYQKISEESSAYRPTNAKASRSPPRCKSKDRYWQEENLNETYSYPYFGPSMPMSWMPPYAHTNPYPSWDKYNTRAHSPYYYKPSRQYYATPRRPTFNEQSYVQDRFNKKESVRSTRKNKEVVEQVYRVKRYGRKSVTSDIIPNEKRAN